MRQIDPMYQINEMVLENILISTSMVAFIRADSNMQGMNIINYDYKQNSQVRQTPLNDC